MRHELERDARLKRWRPTVGVAACSIPRRPVSDQICLGRRSQEIGAPYDLTGKLMRSRACW